MATSKKKQKINTQFIITEYMNHVLEKEEYPKTVYKFCKECKIKEEEFYNFFSSLESVNKGVWDTFYSTTINLMEANKEYKSLSSRDKLLTFFYTFFELLTLNRSYVLFALHYQKVPLKNLNQLKGLRNRIKSFAKELIDTDNDEKSFKITKNPKHFYAEGTWIQFLFLLKFWTKDESVGFEKTDIAIEKSVRTIFDLFDTAPLDNIIDFGKFLWKEKLMWS